MRQDAVVVLLSRAQTSREDRRDIDSSVNDSHVIHSSVSLEPPSGRFARIFFNWLNAY